MKLKFIFSFFFFCSLLTYSSDKFRAPDSLKVIIACFTKDNAKINEVKAVLKSDSTIKYVAFCSNHSVFLIQVGGSQQAIIDKTQLIRKQVNMSDAAFFIKEYSFGDILSFCDSDIEKDLKKRR